MASLASVFQGCSDSLKSLLASQEFGSEYELLCTELSIQWLRVRLWGESVGLEVEENDRPANHIFNRRDIEKTVTQTIHSIAYILSEIEIIRRKYDLRPSSSKSSEDKPKTLRAWKSFSSLFAGSPNPTVLQQRMQENQKQKSFLSIAKWASSDAKRFEEKIKALKSLIDGLESISQAAGVAIRSPSSNNIPTSSSDENPPPYTPRPRTRRRATEGARPSALPNLPESSSPYSTAQTHFAAFKAHLSNIPAHEPRPRHVQKLTRLSEPQLDDMVLDFYDELCRRQSSGQNTRCLPEDPSLDSKRNTARKKLAELPDSRFSNLIADVLAEMSRRFPTLNPPSGSPPSSSSSRPRALTAPSSQLPLPPPPPSSHSSFHLNITPPPSSTSKPLPSPSKANTSSTANLEITKSFRCSPHDRTHAVLPAALKKYGINEPWENYRLVIMCGKEERVLGMEERPLGVFKGLVGEYEDKKGKGNGGRPVFMLRRVGE